jgi:hypothetical protein
VLLGGTTLGATALAEPDCDADTDAEADDEGVLPLKPPDEGDGCTVAEVFGEGDGATAEAEAAAVEAPLPDGDGCREPAGEPTALALGPTKLPPALPGLPDDEYVSAADAVAVGDTTN